MKIICDTHVLLFWADAPSRLGASARTAIAEGMETSSLACSDISLWEIALLFAKGRLRQDVNSASYMNDIVTAMALDVLPITSGIAVLAQSSLFSHKDPADRLIAATAMHHKARLITCDQKLQNIPGLQTVW